MHVWISQAQGSQVLSLCPLLSRLEKLQLELAEAKFAEEEASKAGQLAPLLYDAFRVNAVRA